MNIENLPFFDTNNENQSAKRIIEYVFNNSEVLSYIKKYLFKPKLDQVRIIESPLVLENDQTLWHHDSCGNRIKLYICLDNSLKKSIYTELLPTTNRNTYFDYNFTRIFLTPEEKKLKSAKVFLKSGDIFMFDTNMIHRGHYSNIERRKLIEVEFSSFLRGTLLPGKIGRKKYKRPNNLLDKIDIKCTL